MRVKNLNRHILSTTMALIFGGYYWNGSADEIQKIHTINGTDLFTHEIAQGSEKPDSHAWSEIVGRRVVVQGVAWGAFEKSYGPYVMMNRSIIHIDSNTFPAAKLQGKIVELEGELLVKRYHPAKNAASPNSEVHVYKIKPVRIMELPRMTWPWMRLSPAMDP